jgi:putative FmdB family regulatory protein
VPIYEYRCDACGKRSSALLALWDSPDPACPHCGKTELRRLVSTFATTRSELAADEDDFSGGDEGYGGDSEAPDDFADDDW